MSDPSELFPTHDPEYRRIYEDEAAKVDASEERYDLAEVIRNGVDPGHGALPAEHFYPEADTILASDWLARIKAEAAAEALGVALSLAKAHLDLHPVYSNTSACRGGIGGQAITTHCAVTCHNPVHGKALEAWDEAFERMRRLNNDAGGAGIGGGDGS